MARLNINDQAPDFSLKATDGNTYSLNNFVGKNALAVIFSCVHCPYVLAWEDRIIDVANEYGPKGLGVAYICSNDPVKYPQDNFENMAKHISDKGFPFPFLHDDSQEVARAYGAERTPEVFLFDADRKLVYTGSVDDNYEEPSEAKHHWFRGAVEKAIIKAPVAEPVSAPKGCTIKWK